MPWTLLILTGWLLAVFIFAVVIRRLWTAERSRRRLMLEEKTAAMALPTSTETDGNWLRRRLFVAGFRSPNAPSLFVLATIALLLLGAGLALLLAVSGAVEETASIVGLVPGGAMDVFLPLIYGMPWILVIAFATLPLLGVRNARRARVRMIEQDLPITLELLSTLAESGLAFDSAVDRVIASDDNDRPLSRELQTFRAETLSGRPRVAAFRRLARRVQITSFSSFVSAIVQAEQVGAGTAAVLRRQAEDVRDRRRERAIEAAMALPVKRLVPLAICFMPGIFVWALGPAFSEFFTYVTVFTRNGGAH